MELLGRQSYCERELETNIKVVLRYHNTRGLGGCNLSSQSLTFQAHWIAFS